MSGLRDVLGDLPDRVFADLLESDDAYLLVVDVPGADAGSTDVRVDDGRLHVEARRGKERPEGYHYLREDRATLVEATLPLPPEAGGDVTVDVERGVLEVTIPKRPAESGTEIPIEDA